MLQKNATREQVEKKKKNKKFGVETVVFEIT